MAYSQESVIPWKSGKGKKTYALRPPAMLLGFLLESSVAAFWTSVSSPSRTSRECCLDCSEVSGVSLVGCCSGGFG